MFSGIPNGFDWTPGSDTLIVSFAGNLLAVALGGATTSLAVHEAYNCRVSPDGRTVAFDAAAWTHSAIFTLNRTTSLIQNITADSITCAFPAWAPSGDQLAVVGSTATSSGVMMLTSAGTLRRLLYSSFSFIQAVAWSPVGDKIAWTQQNVGESRYLWWADTLGSPPMRIAACRTGGSWSPDGSTFVFSASSDSGPRLFIADPTGSVRRLNY